MSSGRFYDRELASYPSGNPSSCGGQPRTPRRKVRSASRLASRQETGAVLHVPVGRGTSGDKPRRGGGRGAPARPVVPVLPATRWGAWLPQGATERPDAPPPSDVNCRHKRPTGRAGKSRYICKRSDARGLEGPDAAESLRFVLTPHTSKESPNLSAPFGQRPAEGGERQARLARWEEPIPTVSPRREVQSQPIFCGEGGLQGNPGLGPQLPGAHR